MIFNNLPITNYQVRQFTYYSKIALASIAGIILLGNILTAVFRHSVRVDEKSYEIRDGFPLFISQKEYVSFVKNYPYNPGVSLKIHTMGQGESIWGIALQNRITADTIISANPFLTSLEPVPGTEIAVPDREGVLLAFNDIFDVRRMRNLLNYTGRVLGDYLPTLFKIISTDDVRLVFFPGARPILVNPSLEKLYSYKNVFQSPVNGFYTSLFGDRVHPFSEGISFHSGIDITIQMGTPIKPAREGIVIYTGWKDGFGKTVMIQHYDGYTTLYGHLSEIKVKPGDWVEKADVIGLGGSTGWSTGPHLHFTIMRHGDYINPLFFIW